MKFGELKGSPVVNLANAQTLGTVESMLISREGQRVLGFVVKPGGLFSGREAVRLDDVQAIGTDAVTVADASALNTVEKVVSPEESVDVTKLMRAQVITETGAELGTIADIDADFDTGQVTAYVLGSSILDKLTGKAEPAISAQQVQTMSEKRIVVASPSGSEP